MRRWLLVLSGVLLLAACGAVSSDQGDPRDGDAERLYDPENLQSSRARLLSYTLENPTHALGWILLGNVHEDLDEGVEAEQAYRRALDLDPQAHQALTGLGIISRKRADYDQAMDYYQKAVAIEPDYAQAYSSMAIIELKRYRDSEALELARRAHELDRKDPVIAANLAVAYHYNNLIAERDRMVDECRRLGYDNLDALNQIFAGELTIRD